MKNKKDSRGFGAVGILAILSFVLGIHAAWFTHIIKCNGEMKKGVAIENIMVGIPDFIVDDHVCTMS